MSNLADIGSIIEVTPCDDIFIKTSDSPADYVDDRAPFRFRVKDKLMDGQLFYGLYGPVISGHERYLNLVCNIFLRLDGSDWRKETKSQANFKVCAGVVQRDHTHDFRHPEGTTFPDYPIIGSYAGIRLIDGEK